MTKDIVWRQEVPAEDLVGQCQVALENRRHLSVEVFPAAELLQHLHGQHEDLVEAVLLGGWGGGGVDMHANDEDGCI